MKSVRLILGIWVFLIVGFQQCSPARFSSTGELQKATGTTKQGEDDLDDETPQAGNQPPVDNTQTPGSPANPPGTPPAPVVCKINLKDVPRVACPDGSGIECAQICHIPPGNPEAQHTIIIGLPAVQTHVDLHNDTVGECGKVVVAPNCK